MFWGILFSRVFFSHGLGWCCTGRIKVYLFKFFQYEIAVMISTSNILQGVGNRNVERYFFLHVPFLIESVGVGFNAMNCTFSYFLQISSCADVFHLQFLTSSKALRIETWRDIFSSTFLFLRLFFSSFFLVLDWFRYCQGGDWILKVFGIGTWRVFFYSFSRWRSNPIWLLHFRSTLIKQLWSPCSTL